MLFLFQRGAERPGQVGRGSLIDLADGLLQGVHGTLRRTNVLLGFAFLPTECGTPLVDEAEHFVEYLAANAVDLLLHGGNPGLGAFAVMLRILDTARGTAHRTLVFRQLLFPIPVLVLDVAAFGTDTVLLHLYLFGLFLPGLYATVHFGELLLAKTQLLGSRLDVELRLCHQELVPAGRTGNRTGQFVGQFVDTCRDGTALAAQLVQSSGKVA